MGILKQFASDTVIYGLGKGLKKAVGLIMLPFYTKALSVADYGILETLYTINSLVTIFFLLGLDLSMEYFFFKSESEEERGRLLFTALMMQMVMAIPSLILSMFSEEISIALFESPDYAWAVFITFMMIPVNLILTEQTRLLRFFKEAWQFNLNTLIKTIFGIGMGIYLVIILQKGIAGVLIGNLVSSFLAVVFSFMVYSHKKYTYKFSWTWARKLVGYGFPWIWTMLGSWIYTASDRFILIEYTTLKKVGLYSIGMTISQPILLLNMAVQQSIGVLFFSSYHEEKDPEKPKTKQAISEMFRAFIVAALLIGLFLSVFGFEILTLVTTPEFAEGALVIPFITFSYALAQCLNLTSKGIALEAKNWYFTVMIAFTATLNVGLNLWLIPKFGYVVAAATTLFCNLFYWLAGYVVSQRLFNAPFRIVSALIFISVMFALAFSIPALRLIYHIEIRWFWQLGVLLVGCVLPFATGVFTFREGMEVYHKIRDFIAAKLN